MKQHSAVDVIAALPVCALGWWLGYGKKEASAQTSAVEK